MDKQRIPACEMGTDDTNAGAMAAPAITVSKLMERMVYSNLFFIKKQG